MKLIESLQVTQLKFTCSKSAMETQQQCVISVQSTEAYLEPSYKF